MCFLQAKKEVGGDGIAYLKARVDTLAAAGGDRAALEKMLDEKYVKPAKVMLGLIEGKMISALPQQKVVSWSEILSIPAFYMGMLCGVPIGLTRLQRNPLLLQNRLPCIGHSQ